MTLPEVTLSWAVPSIVSGVLAFLFGILWYSPKVLGNRWLEARGISQPTARPSTQQFFFTFLLWMMAAFFYAFLASTLGVASLPAYFLLSCLLWVAFCMPPIVMGSLYTGYPFNAVAIDASYHLGGYYIFALTHSAFVYFGFYAVDPAAGG